MLSLEASPVHNQNGFTCLGTIVTFYLLSIGSLPLFVRTVHSRGVRGDMSPTFARTFSSCAHLCGYKGLTQKWFLLGDLVRTVNRQSGVLGRIRAIKTNSYVAFSYHWKVSQRLLKISCGILILDKFRHYKLFITKTSFESFDFSPAVLIV